MTTTIETTLAGIAKEHLKFETLASRRHDDLDVHYALNHRSVSVGAVSNTLRAAYRAGRADANAAPAGAATLMDSVRENLSPEAVACIVTHLQGAYTNTAEVDDEVRWLVAELVNLLGGTERHAQLVDALGL